MASSYPTSLDTFTNPTGSDTQDSPDHAGQHADVNDAVESLEAKVGTGAGTPTAGKALVGGSTAGASEWSDEVPVGDGTLSVGDLLVVKSLNPMVVEGVAGGTYAPAVGLYLPGTSGNYVSTPDSAALSITGDIDLRADLTLADWTPGALTLAIAKFAGSGTRSYYLGIDTAGRIVLGHSSDGTATSATPSTVATGVADGARKSIRAVMDVDNGAGGRDLTFYLGDNMAGWVQLGTTVTVASTTTIFDSAQAVEVGSATGGTSNLVTGTVHRAQILSGATEVADLDCRTPASPRYRDSHGNVWTFNGSAYSWTEVA